MAGELCWPFTLRIVTYSWRMAAHRRVWAYFSYFAFNLIYFLIYLSKFAISYIWHFNEIMFDDVLYRHGN